MGLWNIERVAKAASGKSTIVEVVGLFKNYDYHHVSVVSLTFREFKKLRRQLQRKRRIKIELCVQLRLLRLFHVDHVVQNRRTALSLAWYEWFSCKGKE